MESNGMKIFYIINGVIKLTTVLNTGPHVNKL